MTTSPRPFTPLRPRRSDDFDDVQVTSFPLTSDGRWPFRIRPLRLMILLFAAAAATLVLFSQHPLLSGYTHPYQVSLVPRPSTALQNSATTPTVQTEDLKRPVEPVVFALLMYSETSAKEGAILLKVTFLTQIDVETMPTVTHLCLVRNNVY